MQNITNGDKMDKCRICCGGLPDSGGLFYSGMPSCSQYLPEVPGDSGIDLQIVQCPACGTVQLLNEPVHYYREVIRASAYSPEIKEFRKKQFAAWVKKYGLTGGKILEPGCGRGEFLQLMQQAAKVEVFGTEYGDEARQAACNAGLPVEKKFFDRGDEILENAPFDGFFTLNYMEHMPDIGTFLRGVRANLNEGGYGLVEVPDFNVMLKKNMFSEFTIDHLSYFTSETLPRALEMHGFEVLDCRVVWYGYIVSAEVRKRKPLDFSGFRRAENEFFRQLREFLTDAPAEQNAVWGAGHQAFALLAASGLSDRISCILDSADFKWGKYSPASSIKIVPPAELDKGKIRRIVIMAGSYSDEIAGMIKKRYGCRFKTAVVRGNELEIINC